MKPQSNYVGLARRYFRRKSWDVKSSVEEESMTGSYLYLAAREKEMDHILFSSILQLPDDIWVGILSYLQLVDVFR